MNIILSKVCLNLNVFLALCLLPKRKKNSRNVLLLLFFQIEFCFSKLDALNGYSFQVKKMWGIHLALVNILFDKSMNTHLILFIWFELYFLRPRLENKYAFRSTFYKLQYACIKFFFLDCFSVFMVEWFRWQ